MSRIIFGNGINDADYKVKPIINGRRLVCPFYKKWVDMIKRCYSKKEHVRYPSYAGCSVCDEWLVFSNFKSWMELQNWKGKFLDKDILIQGNKIYSPDFCLFVSGRVNTLLINSEGSRGSLKLGVDFHKKTGKYRARCRDGGRTVSIGAFTTENEAFEAYKKFKYQVIIGVAENEKEPVKSALLRYEIK